MSRAPGVRRASLLFWMGWVGAGCAPPVDLAPHPQALLPASGYDQVDTAIQIHGSGFWAKGARQWGASPPRTLDTSFQVWLDSTPLQGVVYLDDQNLRAMVPAGISPGPHALTVLGPYGVSGTLPAAYTALALPPGRVQRPLASFTFTPFAPTPNQPVTFDASASTDLVTATANLQVSWDFQGTAPGPPPWTPWTLLKTATATFPAVGSYAPRLAVRDAYGLVGFATRRVVVSDPALLCTVTTGSLTDDGAVSCAGPYGTDGKLSFTEAVRLANTSRQTLTVTFASPLTVAGPAVVALNQPVNLVGGPGVVLSMLALNATSPGLVATGLEFNLAGFNVSAGGALDLSDSYLHGTPYAVYVQGAATLTRVQAASCLTACVGLNGASASLAVRFSLLRDSPGRPGISLTQCPAAGSYLEVQSTVFLRLGAGVQTQCGDNLLLRHNTFDSNGTGLDLQGGGAGHVVRNNIFFGQTTAAANCGAARFAQRDHHLLFQNASDGCLAGDPFTLAADPLFTAPGADDRLFPQSPAVDQGVDLGLDVNGPAPGNVFGAAPDLGGIESF